MIFVIKKTKIFKLNNPLLYFNFLLTLFINYKENKKIIRILKVTLRNNTNTNTMNLSLLLFLIGILGFILNRKNIILMIIAIELMLLAVTLLILISSFSFDDGIGQTFSIFIISIAGAESVIGLSILVAYYRLRGNISLRT
jgi:NADH-ubiquinone oxidoreductase chain 4L